MASKGRNVHRKIPGRGVGCSTVLQRQIKPNRLEVTFILMGICWLGILHYWAVINFNGHSITSIVSNWRTIIAFQVQDPKPPSGTIIR